MGKQHEAMNEAFHTASVYMTTATHTITHSVVSKHGNYARNRETLLIDGMLLRHDSRTHTEDAQAKRSRAFRSLPCLWCLHHIATSAQLQDALGAVKQERTPSGKHAFYRLRPSQIIVEAIIQYMPIARSVSPDFPHYYRSIDRLFVLILFY